MHYFVVFTNINYGNKGCDDQCIDNYGTPFLEPIKYKALGAHA